MSQVHIAHTGTGYRVYRTENGIDRTDVGPVWPTPKEASHYAGLIREPYVSPLRQDSGDDPLDSSRRVGSSPKPRRGSRRRVR